MLVAMSSDLLQGRDETRLDESTRFFPRGSGDRRSGVESFWFFRPREQRRIGPGKKGVPARSPRQAARSKRGARAHKGERGAVGEGRGGAEVSCELPLSQKGSKR